MGTATRSRNSTRARIVRTSKVSLRVQRRPAPQRQPHFPGILCQFSQFAEAISVVQVTQRSLDAWEIASDEHAALDAALASLNAAYNQLDMEIVGLSKRVRP